MKITQIILILSMAILATSCADKCGKDVSDGQKALNGCFSDKK
jgi:hypothetical protein